MKMIRRIDEMQNISRKSSCAGKSVGFVPTMGCLHEGHLSLVARSVKECDVTVVSIYVNPLQFGPREDLKKYPRDLKRDLSLTKKAGVDYVFVPRDKDMYPEKYLTGVEVGEITKVLCGASRPGHFKGVTTVVAKLFNIVLPDVAYFGQKDAQQAVVIKKMVKDLNIPIKIKVRPIVRERDGLAMSSRNKYLSAQERKDALILSEALKKARQLIGTGERNPRNIILSMKRLISEVKSVKIDYINIVDAGDLSKKEKIKGKVLIVLAAFIGTPRLIDNIIIRA